MILSIKSYHHTNTFDITTATCCSYFLIHFHFYTSRCSSSQSVFLYSQSHWPILPFHYKKTTSYAENPFLQRKENKNYKLKSSLRKNRILKQHLEASFMAKHLRGYRWKGLNIFSTKLINSHLIMPFPAVLYEFWPLERTSAQPFLNACAEELLYLKNMFCII